MTEHHRAIPQGPHFRDYHLLLDEQANQIFAVTDPIAERARKLGGATLRSIGQIARTQRIADNDATFVEPQDMLAELQDDLHLILQETYHRMMNTLTLLYASLRIDLEELGASGFPDAVNRFERRILAFSKLHRLLSDYGDRNRLSVADYLEQLCEALGAAILEPAGLRGQAIVGDGVLAADVCHRLGLIITELVTNAAKHAFPNRRVGLIRVEALYRDGAWRCRVMDNGIGGSSSRQGTGARLLKALARSIRAQTSLETSRRGTAVTVVVPAAQ